MNLGEKAHQRLMTPNSCVEISPRKFNIFPIDLILKVIVILICFHLDCKADSRLQLVSLLFLWAFPNIFLRVCACPFGNLA